jgi:hypothetical protein
MKKLQINLGTFDAQSDMAFVVADGDKCLETCTLTSTSLLLDGHDLQHFVLELGRRQKIFNDLVLLKGERKWGVGCAFV